MNNSANGSRSRSRKRPTQFVLWNPRRAELRRSSKRYRRCVRSSPRHGQSCPAKGRHLPPNAHLRWQPRRPPPLPAAPVAAIPGSLPAPLPAASASPTDEERDSANLLQLARRLHEEHVREGINKRDALIAEGKATAARIGSDAEASMRSKLVALEQERVGLQRRVDELRTFEHDYRRKLRAYIEGQLQDLDSASVVQARATGTPGTPFPGSVA